MTSSPHQQSFLWSLRGEDLCLRPAARASSDEALHNAYEPNCSRVGGVWLAYAPARELGSALRDAALGTDLSWMPLHERLTRKLAAAAFNAVGTRCAIEEGETWVPVGANALPTDEARRSHTRDLAAFSFLCRLAEAIGHGLPVPKWHALAAIPIWHPQFGPGYAAASDGARVVLLASPHFGSDWLMAHSRNVHVLPRSTPASTRRSRRQQILDSI